MTNHTTGAPSSTETPPRDHRLLIVLALAAGLTIGVLTAAFAQGYGWHPGLMGGWHHGFMGGGWGRAGFMGGPLSPAPKRDPCLTGGRQARPESGAGRGGESQ